VEGKKEAYLDDLEAHTGDITDGVTRATEAGNQHLVLQTGVILARCRKIG
jgi:hypothetical protein